MECCAFCQELPGNILGVIVRMFHEVLERKIEIPRRYAKVEDSPAKLRIFCHEIIPASKEQRTHFFDALLKEIANLPDVSLLQMSTGQYYGTTSVLVG